MIAKPKSAVARMQAAGREPGVLVCMLDVVPDSIAFHPGYVLCFGFAGR